MALEHAALPAARGVPQPHRPVGASAGQQASVGRERHGADRPGVPRERADAWPVAGSHSHTVPSTPALASTLPSGENATPITQSAWPSSTWVCRPLAGSHNRTPSRLALASTLPSGENATPFTTPVLPSSVPVGWPLAGSHSRTVLSPALASTLPSGENATALTQPVWPSSTRVRAGGASRSPTATRDRTSEAGIPATSG